MTRWTTLALVAVALFAVACEEQKPAAPTTGEKAAATPVQLKDEDLPTVADFDDESAKDISATNYKAEVDALEKEISAE
ncbi:MAG TPA: hypothetical protein PKA58_06610 [Polyangium sp.]|nr:hypothetical protein [Polyangium sp.]